MTRARLLSVVVLLAGLFCASAGASAQTRTLTLHTVARVISGSGPSPVATCNPFGSNLSGCTLSIDQGATVEVAAGSGESLSGSGPAASCALTTCTFTMTADADVTYGSGGTNAMLTMTIAGDAAGTVWADGVPCAAGTCTVNYRIGSTVHLTAASGTAGFAGYSSAAGDTTACGSSRACTFTLNGAASVTATFTALTSFTVAPSNAIAVPGGAAQTFTATGGYTDGSTAPIAPTAGAWAAGPSLPAGLAFHAAAELGGAIYAVGGGLLSMGTNVAMALDPATQTWTSRAPMLAARMSPATATAGGLLYAIGGTNNHLPLSSVERYNPVVDTWTMCAPMSVPRGGLVAGSVNGIIYAAGGADASNTPLAALEAYNPATDSWTARAPMPTPRSAVSGGVIDGILYVVGGLAGPSYLSAVSTVEAYDPATNTWSAKAHLPGPISGAASAVADGVLYVFVGMEYDYSVVYAYDPVADAWSVKTPMPTPLYALGAASFNGVVYAIGGSSTDVFHTVKLSPVVQTFVDGLRWSSSAPAVARVDQTGRATPLAAGKATIIASVGGTTCGSSCPTFSVVGPSDLSLDLPARNSAISGSSTFSIGGWAINRAAVSGSGVDAVHVYVQPAGESLTFVGAAYGTPRPDIGALYGSQFTNSGFLLQDQSLAPGSYTIFAFAHNAITNAFDASASTHITVTAGVSNPAIAVDTPVAGQTVTSAFEVGGWALDQGTPTGTGVDSVQFYLQPQGQPAPGIFVGTGTYGIARPDLAAIYGARFTNVGYHVTITGLSSGTFTLNVYARSTVTNSYSILKSVPITVSATTLMSIDTPSPEATIAASTFLIGGWSIDRSVEGTALSGSGVDALHVYAYPNPGSGQPPIFLGVAAVGVSRPDVGAAYGSRYDTSGYQLVVDRTAAGLAPGLYGIVVHSRSAVSGQFNNDAVVWVTLQ